MNKVFRVDSQMPVLLTIPGVQKATPSRIVFVSVPRKTRTGKSSFRQGRIAIREDVIEAVANNGYEFCDGTWWCAEYEGDEIVRLKPWIEKANINSD